MTYGKDYYCVRLGPLPEVFLSCTGRGHYLLKIPHVIDISFVRNFQFRFVRNVMLLEKQSQCPDDKQ